MDKSKSRGAEKTGAVGDFELFSWDATEKRLIKLFVYLIFMSKYFYYQI